jgi:hypothetical protein
MGFIAQRYKLDSWVLQASGIRSIHGFYMPVVEARFYGFYIPVVEARFR